MKSAYVEMNEDCNLRCVFCSRGDRKGSRTVDEIKGLLKTYREEGYEKALLTGGEPFLHQGLAELVEYADSLGFRVAIQTNGTLVTPERVRAIRDAGVNQVVFSIHSHLPVMEDRIMRGEGVLEKQLAGIRAAHEAGVDSSITTLALRPNYRLFPEIFTFFINELDFVNHFTINFVDPIGRSADNSWVVPRLSEVEPFLMGALMALKRANKTFRVERVPLCYMLEFAEYGTEMRRMWTREPVVVHRDNRSDSYVKGYFEREYVYGQNCESCWLKAICPGLDVHYAEVHGTDEVYPIFVEPEVITRRSGED